MNEIGFLGATGGLSARVFFEDESSVRSRLVFSPKGASILPARSAGPGRLVFSAQRANSLLSDAVAFELPALQASDVSRNRSQGLSPWLGELLALWAGR